MEQPQVDSRGYTICPDEPKTLKIVSVNLEFGDIEMVCRGVGGEVVAEFTLERQEAETLIAELTAAVKDFDAFHLSSQVGGRNERATANNPSPIRDSRRSRHRYLWCDLGFRLGEKSMGVGPLRKVARDREFRAWWYGLMWAGVLATFLALIRIGWK